MKFEEQIFPPMAFVNVPNAANRKHKSLFSKDFSAANGWAFANRRRQSPPAMGPQSVCSRI